MKSGFLTATLLVVSISFGSSCFSQENSATNAVVSGSSESASPVKIPAPLHITSLIKIDTKLGTGAEAVYGANVEVHYTGWIYNPKAEDLHGAQFDSSYNQGKPFVFMLGARQVILGWDKGIIGMKVGGKRTLRIPSYMAYGTNGSSGIPPNTHLVFDVELLNVK